MAKKRVKAKFYESGFVGNDIVNKSHELVTSDTPVAWTEADAYGEGRRRNPRRDIARDTYARLGLNYFPDKDAMREELSTYDKSFWNHHNINKFWEEYLARDRLIAAGLYEKARQEVYTENYLRTAAQYMGDDKALEVIRVNLGKLTTKEFISLTKPQADRDKMTTALPSIQEFYALTSVRGQADYYEDIIKRFKQAFQEAGVHWEDLPEPEEEPEVVVATASQEYSYPDYEYDSGRTYEEILDDAEKSYKAAIETKYTGSRYAKVLRQAYKYSPKKVRQRIAITGNENPRDIFDERKEALRALKLKEEDLLKRGKALVFVNKSGDLYIPFVRKDIAKDYLKHYYGK